MKQSREYIEYLKIKRREERSDSFDLLWENLEHGRFTKLHPGSAKNDILKCRLQARHCAPTISQFFIVFSHSCLSLEDDDVRSILQFGAARRYGSVRSAVLTVLRVAPPERTIKLSRDEAQALSDAVLLIYVHIVGIIDAFGIAFMRIGSLSGEERYADLLKADFRRKIGIPELDQIFVANDHWLSRVKEQMRNRFVHRIPPYVPDAAMTKDEAAQFNLLEERKFEMLKVGDLAAVDEIEVSQEKIGRFDAVLAFSDTNSLMFLYPTILDDIYRLNVLSLDILEILLEGTTRDNL